MIAFLQFCTGRVGFFGGINMFSRRRRALVALLSVQFMILCAFQNCADPSFTSASASSSAKPAGSDLGEPTATDVPVRTLCSNKRTEDAGSNVSEASRIELIVMDSAKQIVCKVRDGIKDRLLSHHAIDLSRCAGLSSGEGYSISINDPDVASKSLLYDTSLDSVASIPIARSAAGWRIASSKTSKSSSSTPYVLFGLNNSDGEDQTDVPCDRTASPLVVNMTPKGERDPGPLLTSPSAGVLFDILGSNATPAYLRQRIGWIRNPNYMFLVLPTGGRVDGVDQLFGNNTRGPDGQFASNGYIALKKHDSNRDGLIDSRDSVFNDLRLWSDRNLDGVAQASELTDLGRAGIKSFEVEYNESYFEVDAFGNQVRYRSKVRTESSSREMYDIWFAME